MVVVDRQRGSIVEARLACPRRLSHLPMDTSGRGRGILIGAAIIGIDTGIDETWSAGVCS